MYLRRVWISFGFAVITATAASAQDSGGLAHQVDRLSRQLQMLEQRVYQGGPLPAPAPSSVAPVVPVSVDPSLLSQIQVLTGEVEQINHRLNGIEAKLASLTAPPPPSQPQPFANNTLPSETSSPAHEQYYTAQNLLEAGDLAAAKKAFEAFLQHNPGHELEMLALFGFGEVEFQLGNFKESATFYLKAYQKDPKAPKAAEALLKLGTVLVKLGKKEEACATFSKLAKDIPDAPVEVMDEVANQKQSLGCS